MLTAMESAIRARKLTKRFGPLVAVDGIDFEVGAGECFGFLGPNGAGKTTTIRMIHAVIPITSGELIVLGRRVDHDPAAVKRRLGVVPQEENLDPDLTPGENLVVFARYFDLPRAEARRRAADLLEFVGLSSRATSHLDELSGGMKRRLLIARALLNQPELLVLDEPTTGLDPQARHLVWQRLRTLKAQGVTQVLTTHYMDEAAHLCDRVALMDAGRILRHGRPMDLVREVASLGAGRGHPLPVLQGGPRAAAGPEPPAAAASRASTGHPGGSVPQTGRPQLAGVEEKHL
jgi:lipooligosaccharide transport system ATP-binding protein